MTQFLEVASCAKTVNHGSKVLLLNTQKGLTEAAVLALQCWRCCAGAAVLYVVFIEALSADDHQFGNVWPHVPRIRPAATPPNQLHICLELHHPSYLVWWQLSHPSCYRSDFQLSLISLSLSVPQHVFSLDGLSKPQFISHLYKTGGGGGWSLLDAMRCHPLL